jgi:predicted amino acid dehydrogenase
MSDEGEDIRFALLGHPASYDHFVRLCQDSAKPAINDRLNRHRKTFAKFVNWMPSYVTHHRPVVRLSSGVVEGRLIVCPFFPDEIKTATEMKRAYEKVVSGCELAQQIGAKVVSLGGFTSILEGANGNALAERLGLTITSGNSLTAALAVAQLLNLLEDADRPIERETVAVIGATGDVGRNCALMLAKRARRIYLIARNRARLEALQQEIGGPGVEIATDPQAALAARVIVAAAASATPVLNESDLASGTIVCDLGYPKNFSEAPETRRDVLIFSGGLANFPEPVDLQSYAGLPTQRLLHGCFSEGIVLAARSENLRLAAAQGHADVDRANTLLQLAAELGIVPAPPYRGNRLLDQDALADFRGYEVLPTDEC